MKGPDQEMNRYYAKPWQRQVSVQDLALLDREDGFARGIARQLRKEDLGATHPVRGMGMGSGHPDS